MTSSTTFEANHQDLITGQLTCFDRMIFKGYLTGFFGEDRFQRFLGRQGILLKDFGRYGRYCPADSAEEARR